MTYTVHMRVAHMNIQPDELESAEDTLGPLPPDGVPQKPSQDLVQPLPHNPRITPRIAWFQTVVFVLHVSGIIHQQLLFLPLLC